MLSQQKPPPRVPGPEQLCHCHSGLQEVFLSFLHPFLQPESRFGAQGQNASLTDGAKGTKDFLQPCYCWAEAPRPKGWAKRTVILGGGAAGEAEGASSRVWQPWEAMELSGSAQVTGSTSTCCSLPGASRLGASGPSALPSPEQPLCSLPGSRRAFPTLLGPAGLSRTGTAAAGGVSGAGRQPPAGHRGHTCTSPLHPGGCGGRGHPPCATAPAQSREPAVPGAVACSSGENFSALPLRRLQSTNHSIYCFFSPQHRSSHIGLWGESGSNVLCHLQITRAFEKTPPPPPQSTPTPRPLHTQKSVKMSLEAWLPQPTLFLTGLTLLLSLAPPGLGMEVMAPATINALNGSSVKLSCTFNSCYKVENKQFSLNWTYQECSNCSEELFLQFRTKIMNKQLDRFGNRVEFTGNPAKYDVSFTLKNVQLEDEGTYNCYVLNPPDRHRGHGKISLKVLTKEPQLLGRLRAGTGGSARSWVCVCWAVAVRKEGKRRSGAVPRNPMATRQARVSTTARTRIPTRLKDSDTLEDLGLVQGSATQRSVALRGWAQPGTTHLSQLPQVLPLLLSRSKAESCKAEGKTSYELKQQPKSSWEMGGCVGVWIASPW
uniref:Sodium voltage-gated channel beta subunit 2 n=1 Tax=Corvus moneduloides TaxID=1196302 RepID=A0A8C3ELX6_CORMO